MSRSLPAKLLVMMTLPIDPESKTKDEQSRELQRIKSAFLDGDTSAVIVSMVAEPLARFEEVTAHTSHLKLISSDPQDNNP